MKDIIGNALRDYWNGNYTEDIITSTQISYEDELPLPYLFRTFREMPELEQMALRLVKGHVLDVGCGAGGHSLYVQEKGHKVTSIDISPGAIEVCKQRGLKDARCKDLLEMNETFDTILLLMNGTGMFQTMDLAPTYLRKLKECLNPGGQILIDSSDIRYMYDPEDLGVIFKSNTRYYGELDFKISYKGETDEETTWIYIDFDTLEALSDLVGLKCIKISEGKHFDYLAKLFILT